MRNNGKEFERKVLNIFREELEHNRLFVKSDFCKIHHRKGYYSKDRNGKIIVDISIEVFLPGESDYSILIVLECKNYNHPVPVDDVEEFFSKLQQISGANVKGIIISSNLFQIGALNYSRSKGIGLVRVFDDNKFKWILTRAVTGIITYKEVENVDYNIREGLTDENYVSTHIDFFSYYDDQYTYSAHFLFNILLNPIIEREGIGINKILVEDKEEYFVPFIP